MAVGVDEGVAVGVGDGVGVGAPVGAGGAGSAAPNDATCAAVKQFPYELGHAYPSGSSTELAPHWPAVWITLESEPTVPMVAV